MTENYGPRRIVSLQPSITVTLRDLGLLDHLAACTKYCRDICPEVEQAGCAIVEDSWTADASEILAARPDFVIASVPYQQESLAEILKAGIPCLCLSPKSLRDVLADIATIARLMSAEERGQAVIRRMQDEIASVSKVTAHAPAPLVYCEEWGKPLILSQAWVAELVEAAGGKFYGTPGKQTTVDDVVAADPEIIVASWCGAGDRVPLEKIIPQRGWDRTRAGRAGQVFCINDEFLNTPASTLIHGLRALAAAIHPELFPAAPGLRQINAYHVTS